MFYTFCFFYIHLELEKLQAIRRKMQNKFLTDRTKNKINQSIFCYFHIYANNTHRYFSMVPRGAPKNFSICPNSGTSSPAPPLSKLVPFLNNSTRSVLAHIFKVEAASLTLCDRTKKSDLRGT